VIRFDGLDGKIGSGIAELLQHIDVPLAVLLALLLSEHFPHTLASVMIGVFVSKHKNRILFYAIQLRILVFHVIKRSRLVRKVEVNIQIPIGHIQPAIANELDLNLIGLAKCCARTKQYGGNE
jgi:hypothetical protein